MELSLGLGEWWWSDDQESRLIFLVFKTCGDLEDRMNGDESTLDSKIDRLLILKKYLKNFEVDSNLEDVRLMNLILNSEDSSL